jgi:hypothetical protein
MDLEEKLLSSLHRTWAHQRILKVGKMGKSNGSLFHACFLRVVTLWRPGKRKGGEEEEGGGNEEGGGEEEKEEEEEEEGAGGRQIKDNQEDEAVCDTFVWGLVVF